MESGSRRLRSDGAISSALQAITHDIVIDLQDKNSEFHRWETTLSEESVKIHMHTDGLIPGPQIVIFSSLLMNINLHPEHKCVVLISGFVECRTSMIFRH